MSKKTDQLSFDLKRAADSRSDSVPVSTPKQNARTIVYSLGEHRAAKATKETSAHFSAILSLVSHFKR